VLRPVLAPLKVFPQAFKEHNQVTICSELVDKSPGYCPSLEEVMAMSLVELRDTYITKLHYHAGGIVTRLAFETSGRFLSPPLGTYIKDPDEFTEMPKNNHIRRVVLSMHKMTPSNWCLASI